MVAQTIGHVSFCRMAMRYHKLCPQHVKPFFQGNKNDKNDARAIAIALQQDSMPTVLIKMLEQQEV